MKTFLRKLNNDRFLNVLIVVLAVIAIVLGVLIIKQKKIGLDFAFLNTGEKKSDIKSSIPNSPQDYSGVDRETLLSPPGPNASEEENRQFFDMVRRFSEESDILTLNKCENPSPLVIKVRENEEFSVLNNDSEEHTIVTYEDRRYALGANETIKIKAEFGRGTGTYGYSCDDLTRLVGYFDVIP